MINAQIVRKRGYINLVVWSVVSVVNQKNLIKGIGKRKELEWRRKKLMERLSDGVGSALYENNVEWRNMTAILNGMNIKKEWRIKYSTISIAIIALIISIIVSFKP